MSEHSVKVITISEVRPHDNADKLEIVPIGGWQAVVRKGDFAVGDLAIYVEPDYVVPLDRAEFKFLDKDGKGKLKHRLKAIRLRGALSYGLLIPVPEWMTISEESGPGIPATDRKPRDGDDVMALLDIERWEPKVHAATTATMLDKSFWPNTYTPTFDVENLQNHMGAFGQGEEVIVTEKIDGANSRFLYLDGKFHIGSRTRWLKWDERMVKDEATGELYPPSIWAIVHERYPQIERWCREHEGVTLFGEIFGRVQDLKYGRENEIDFRAFAALKNDTWLEWMSVARDLHDYDVPVVPVLYIGPYDRLAVMAMVEQDSLVYGAPKGHIMEGGVVTAVPERKDSRGNRISLKLISNRFWLADNK